MARVTAATMLAVTLAGCAAQGGGQAIRHSEPTFLRLSEERVFAQALRQRYLELATNAYDRADLSRSDFYSLRAIMAVEGKLVDPAGNGAQSDPTLSAARAQLDRSLARGARLGAPDLAARAQAGYDCWWLESQSGGDPAIADACAGNTAEVLSRLDTIGTGFASLPQPAPQRIMIDENTPSQSIDMGGSTVEIVRHQRTAPADTFIAPSYVAPAPPVAPLAALPAEPARHSYALAERMPDFEPMESQSVRTFVVEPPAPLAGTTRRDTVIATVPFPDLTAPVDLIPDYEAILPFSSTGSAQQGGQYVPTPGYGRQASIGDLAPSVPFAEARTMPFASPVYSDAVSASAVVAPVMMDQSDGVLSSLLEARRGSAADFSVYFGFDSAELTPEGEDVLGDTVERLALEDRGVISLMGFTDSAGDSRYNQLLAMRRANAVRSFIQQRVERPVRFEIMPVGEAEAVRNGGDGVTEALNRRVEVMLR